MSTPTTVKFQIAVPLTNGGGEAAEKVYTLALSLLVEGGGEDGEIRIMPLLRTSFSEGSAEGEPGIVPGSGAMPIEDPPQPAPVTN